MATLIAGVPNDRLDERFLAEEEGVFIFQSRALGVGASELRGGVLVDVSYSIFVVETAASR